VVHLELVVVQVQVELAVHLVHLVLVAHQDLLVHQVQVVHQDQVVLVVFQE
jgi:hypothetical protein